MVDWHREGTRERYGGFDHVSGGCDRGDCLLGDGLQEMGCVLAMGVGRV